MNITRREFVKGVFVGMGTITFGLLTGCDREDQRMLYVVSDEDVNDGDNTATIYLSENTTAIYENTLISSEAEVGAGNGLLVSNSDLAETISNLAYTLDLCNANDRRKDVVLLKYGTFFRAAFVTETYDMTSIFGNDYYNFTNDKTSVATNVEVGDFLVIPSGWKFNIDPKLLSMYGIDQTSSSQKVMTKQI